MHSWSSLGKVDQVTQYDVGIAGSIIMIGLSIATVILFISFYRRYKKMSQKKPNE
jgi:hypothetical protein